MQPEPDTMRAQKLIQNIEKHRNKKRSQSRDTSVTVWGFSPPTPLSS